MDNTAENGVIMMTESSKNVVHLRRVLTMEPFVALLPIITKILVSIIVVIGVTFTVLEMISSQRTKVIIKVMELLRDRDDAIQADLVSRLPADQRERTMDYIRKAFDEGDKRWSSEFLPVLTGGKASATRILQKLEKSTFLNDI